MMHSFYTSYTRQTTRLQDSKTTRLQDKMDFPPPPPLIRVIRSAYWQEARYILTNNSHIYETIAHTCGDWTYIISCHPTYNNPHSRYTRIYYYKDSIVYTEPDVSYSFYYEY